MSDPLQVSLHSVPVQIDDEPSGAAPGDEGHIRWCPCLWETVPSEDSADPHLRRRRRTQWELEAEKTYGPLCMRPEGPPYPGMTGDGSD